MTWLVEMQRIFLERNIEVTDTLDEVRQVITFTSKHKGYQEQGIFK